jgi:hypothetical protein
MRWLLASIRYNLILSLPVPCGECKTAGLVATGRQLSSRLRDIHPGQGQGLCLSDPKSRSPESYHERAGPMFPWQEMVVRLRLSSTPALTSLTGLFSCLNGLGGYLTGKSQCVVNA